MYVLLALPAVAEGGAGPLLLAAETGAATAFTAVLLSAVSRSAFAPRLILLIAWYACEKE